MAFNTAQFDGNDQNVKQKKKIKKPSYTSEKYIHTGICGICVSMPLMHTTETRTLKSVEQNVSVEMNECMLWFPLQR